MILFTGLTGTSGRALVDVLIREKFGEHFRIIVRETSNLDQLKNSGLDYELFYGSIEEVDSFKEAINGISTVFHIAAKAKLGNVARVVAESPTVKQCIFVSSTSIYSKYRAASDKITVAEKEMKELFAEKNISWTLIRPTMIFGTLNDHNISTFMRWLDKYTVFPIVKSGNALLQPVNKCDIAEAYYLILINLEKAANKEYIVSGKEPKTLKETLNLIGESISKKNILVNVPLPLAEMGVNIFYWVTLKKVDVREKLFRLTEDRAFDHKNITEEFGYQPHSFEDWIGQLAEEYLKAKKKG